MIAELPDADDVVAPEPFAGPDHPMRKVTRQVAFDGGAAWDGDRAVKVAGLFNGMAEGWSAGHVDDVRARPVVDALRRGGVRLDGAWLEIGSGTGAGALALEGHVADLVCCDLAKEMLAHAPADLAPRVQTDASRLPFGDDRFDAVLMINMLLFPHEVDRVLRPGGHLVWVNTLGDQTPIHLPPADVLAALPGSWSGVTANSGSGFWATFSRT